MAACAAKYHSKRMQTENNAALKHLKRVSLRRNYPKHRIGRNKTTPTMGHTKSRTK